MLMISTLKTQNSMSKVIWSGPAQLLHTITHTPDSDAPVILQLHGTVWSPSYTGRIGLKLAINGDSMMSSEISCDQVNVHMATPVTLQSVLLPVKVVDGVIQPVTFTVDVVDNDTTFDENDVYSLLLID